jgi:hypothetical protein
MGRLYKNKYVLCGEGGVGGQWGGGFPILSLAPPLHRARGDACML